MAITICSSPNHSPTLPTISSLKPLHSSQFQTLSPYSSSVKFGLGLVSDDAMIIAAADEAAMLANAALEAARDAVLSATATGEILFYEEEGEKKLKIDGGDMVGVRRKRRRKRRKWSEYSETKEKNGNGEDQQVLFRPVKSGFLTRREEAELSLCFKEGARLEAVRKRILEPMQRELTSNQWAKAVGLKRRSLDRKLCNGRESRERITSSYRRLVVSIASGYQGKGLGLEDLIQEGSIGLLRGVERFDPERGYKLSTYVYWWIRQAIIRAIENKSRVVRLPGSTCEMLAKIAEANNVLSRRLRRLPRHDEIAEMLNVHVSRVKLVTDRSRRPISLDGGTTHLGCMTLKDIIPGPDETMPETMVKKKLMKLTLEELLNSLSEREAHILRLHFGLNGDTTLSCEEIGRLLKLSRERVRQIIGIALSKLRQMGSVDDLKVYIE